MEPRIEYAKALPAGIEAMRGLEMYVRRSGLEPSLLELVRTRASQVNGCAYCIDMHTKDARAAEESEQRLYALSAWREAPFFTERERAALTWTEAVTKGGRWPRSGRGLPAGARALRREVVLPQAERDRILAEMRQRLGSVSGILQWDVANDVPAIEKAARASGMTMTADPQFMKKLPKAFVQLGIQTHRGFDKLADQVKAGGIQEETITTLATLSANCMACHAVYRLDEAG